MVVTQTDAPHDGRGNPNGRIRIGIKLAASVDVDFDRTMLQ